MHIHPPGVFETRMERKFAEEGGDEDANAIDTNALGEAQPRPSTTASPTGENQNVRPPRQDRDAKAQSSPGATVVAKGDGA